MPRLSPHSHGTVDRRIFAVLVLIASLSSLVSAYANTRSQNAIAKGAPILASFVKDPPLSVPTTKLTLINNPECLSRADLADEDLGVRAVTYDDLEVIGRNRVFYGHKNCGASSSSVHYAIVLTNRGTTAVSITTYGSGFSLNGNGGDAWTRLFSSFEARPTQQMLEPNQDLYIVRTDTNIDGSGSATPNGAMSGVIEFEASGIVRMRTFAYVNFANVVLTSLAQMTFVTRSDATVNEKRNYKGIAATSQVSSTINVVISEDDSGVFQFRHPTFSVSTRAYGDSEAHSELYTNVSPAAEALAVLSDIVPLRYVSDEINPTSLFTITGEYPHLNNMGVIYSVSGFIRNDQDEALTVSFSLQTPESAYIAYSADGNRWQSIMTPASSPVDYITKTVNGKDVAFYQVHFVLGFPDSQKLIHQIHLCCGDEDEDDSGLSGGAIFLIIFFVSGGVYLGGGVAYNHFKNGLNGTEAVPHIDFWRRMMQYVKDGCSFTMGLITRRSSSSYATTDAAPVRPQSSAYDTFAGGEQYQQSNENPFRGSATE
eukprot:TRINITY_DN7509_c0_g4_i2.p1 TRINITY_DN7509_c0_g4~~TRINITY_DN7509_c0_g4_i2.p1  ORF type:complete len:541 (+),score=101.46 TRINITY_DN7509_c0_g4_i2:48-1670(+)